MEKYQYYNGLKFTRDEKTGYYLNATNRIRMHRYVWECINGPIPERTLLKMRVQLRQRGIVPKKGGRGIRNTQRIP